MAIARNLLPIVFGLLIFLPEKGEALGPGVENIDILGSVVTAEVVLLEGIRADLRIEFEEVNGLTEQSLGLSAELIHPTDIALLARLPSVSGLSIPVGFPLLLRFDPPPGSPLSFRGVTEVEIYTKNLNYAPGSILRLFAAPPGEPFEDVSAWMDSGSYRVGAVHPEFYREHLIILDPRPFEAVVGQQLEALEASLQDHVLSISGPVWSELDQLLLDVRAAWSQGSPAQARTVLATFEQRVVEESGVAIPDLWEAGSELVNAAGELRAGATRLDLSLLRQAGGLP